jgi:phosphoribosylaminoimidazole-succinocarboxamide synthase
MSAEHNYSLDVPLENFARGLRGLEIPELGDPVRGKVRDSWVYKNGPEPFRVMVTTDRQSAFDRVLATVPGKGRVLNLISAYWFAKTRDIIPNQIVSVPHPNVTIAREASQTLPVEVVVRGYMARSQTSTSVYYNYAELGRRNIYGLDFPEGLRPNERFPDGTIVTPTTKATEHDEELTNGEAQEIVDRKLGNGIWEQAKTAAVKIFDRSAREALSKGLILVDTKYEFGIDTNGQLMIIDEMHSPDSSRYWLASTYEEKFENGQTPDTFDKEILRRWLADRGFRGDGPVPKIDPQVIDEMSRAYEIPFEMITGRNLPSDQPSELAIIRSAVLRSLQDI